jgi:hypothetical protein
MNHIRRAYERLHANPGMTVAEAVQSTKQLPRRSGRGSHVLMFTLQALLAVWTVARTHKGQRRH